MSRSLPSSAGRTTMVMTAVAVGARVPIRQVTVPPVCLCQVLVTRWQRPLVVDTEPNRTVAGRWPVYL